MAATKFTEAEREKLFAQLEAPFDPALIKWRVMRTSADGRSGVILPFADPRAYTDRLNELFTPSGWTREYTISTVPSLCRTERGKVIVTSKVLVATAVTITRLGSHTGTGEEWADRANAATSADAQAFKRACSCFGLDRYLYRFGETRARLNSRGEPMAICATEASLSVRMTTQLTLQERSREITVVHLVDKEKKRKDPAGSRIRADSVRKLRPHPSIDPSPE